jgi:hypothetical protein
MINSAEELVALRSSSLKDDYDRAAMEEAPIGVWRDVISQFPEYRPWVAHNKTILLEILEELANSTLVQDGSSPQKGSSQPSYSSAFHKTTILMSESQFVLIKKPLGNSRKNDS